MIIDQEIGLGGNGFGVLTDCQEVGQDSVLTIGPEKAAGKEEAHD